MVVGTTPKQPTVFWGNDRVTHEAIIAQASEETRQRVQHLEQVLLVQDTVSFNLQNTIFTDHCVQMYGLHKVSLILYRLST